MKIAVVTDPYIPVPPKWYGGVERLVDLLVKGLLKRGHSVTLFAHPGSKVACELVPFGIPPYSSEIRGRRVNRCLEVLDVWIKLSARRGNFDVVHSFGRLVNLLPFFFEKIPKVQTYERAVNKWNVSMADKLSSGSVFFTSCSDSLRKHDDLPGKWKTIYNMIPIEQFEFNQAVPEDAPLMFLGRIEKIKGCHSAIEAARKAGRRLIIAGNVVKRKDGWEYFKKEIEPNVDGKNILFEGEVDDRRKNELLKNSAALLMPIEWEEPFGIVMAEALACGTPVIGFNRGAVGEIVSHGVNGFICETAEEMAAFVNALGSIDRKKCREMAEEKFSDDVIVREYLDLYNSLRKTS